MRRFVSTILATALLGGLSAAAAPSASACSPRSAEFVNVVTLHVAVKPLAKSYRKGQSVPVKVVVTRPASEDPAGLGLSYERPVGRPAADVNVGIGISIGRSFLPGFGVTDNQGRATVRIKLPGYVPSGKTADLRAFAYKTAVKTICVTVEEQGYQSVPRAFKVR